MSGRDKATNQLKDYQKKRGPGVRTVTVLQWSVVMQTAEELMAEKVSCKRESFLRFPYLCNGISVLVNDEIWGQPGQSNHPHVFSPPRSGAYCVGNCQPRNPMVRSGAQSQPLGASRVAL